MRGLLRKFALFFFNESFFFDDQAKPIRKLNKNFLI